MDKWQTITDMEVNQGEHASFLVRVYVYIYIHTHAARSHTSSLSPPTESISQLEPYCSEFLIHAADNEGLQRGVDEQLITKLSQWCTIPVTYAGGGRNLQDLDNVARLSRGTVDLTIGSALDCFGGSGVRLDECVEWNRQQAKS